MPIRSFFTAIALIGAASLLVTAAAASVAGSSTRSTGQDGSSTSPLPAPPAAQGVPASMLLLYRQAALACPGLPWSVLAAIGTVESSNGTSELPGVHSGANGAGAEGPMQFEPRTFARYDEPVPPGGAEPPSPYDPVDSVYAAARLLCADGASGGSDLEGAVFAYNHSRSYVEEVMSLAQQYSTRY